LTIYVFNFWKEWSLILFKYYKWITLCLIIIINWSCVVSEKIPTFTEQRRIMGCLKRIGSENFVAGCAKGAV